MKRLYLNLKRFDIPRNAGGINDFAKSLLDYGSFITKKIEKMPFSSHVTVFFQEAHLIKAIKKSKKVSIGCQGVYYDDVSPSGGFGAYTTFRTASSMKSLGVKEVLIGHSEERAYLNYLTNNSKTIDVNEIFNKQILSSTKQGLKVLYCIGEKESEQSNKFEILEKNLAKALQNVDLSLVSIAYEPIWSIGPGKPVPSKEYITEIAKFIKSKVNVPIVYGGGLKEENAEMIASIKELDGGLIALTNFGSNFGFSLDGFKNIVNKYLSGVKHED